MRDREILEEEDRPSFFKRKKNETVRLVLITPEGTSEWQSIKPVEIPFQHEGKILEIWSEALRKIQNLIYYRDDTNG